MAQVVGLHVAGASRAPMQPVERIVVEAGAGIVGDRHHGTRHRHVSVQAADALAEAAAVHGAPVPAELTRRNITISGREVPAQPGTRVRIGQVVLEVVRIAAPCRVLDEEIGTGARVALRRRAGSVFRALTGGEVQLGDVVELLGPADPGAH